MTEPTPTDPKAEDDFAGDPPLLMVVEDDERFSDTVAAEFRDRGYAVVQATSLSELRERVSDNVDYAVVDLRLRRDSGLDAIEEIRQHSPQARIVVLTGYGSIATAVQATKLGAVNYLRKPVDIDEIEHALTSDDFTEEIEIPEEFQSLDRHEREYIEWVLAQCGGNISQAARRLGLHRQSLQRKLRKFTPR